ncbi:MAG: PAS domain-containing sensor histidine kinase [Candidatus Neomarinimicrobiota bacterium]
MKFDISLKTSVLLKEIKALKNKVSRYERYQEERRQAEDKIRKLSTAVEQSPSSIIITDLQGFIEYVNPKFEQITGYTAEEVIGTKARIFEKHQDKYDNQVWQAILSGGEWKGEFRNFTKAGQPFWERASVSSIRDSAGTMTHILKISEDITESKESEMLLEESEERWHSLANNAPNFIAIVDRKGLIQYQNRTVYSVLGDVVGKSIFDFVTEKFRDIARQSIEQVFKTGEMIAYESIGFSLGDSKSWYNVQMGALTLHGKVVEVMIIANDITALQKAVDDLQKHRRELRRLSAKLLKAQEAGNKMISKKLHDEFGQTLALMSINLTVVERTVARKLDPESQQRLSDTLTLLIQSMEQIRDLSHELRPTMLDDLGLIPTLRWYIKAYTHRHNIKLDMEFTDLKERLRPEIETAIFRIIQESLTNIARHSNADHVKLRIGRRNAFIYVATEDNGRGFDLSQIDNPDHGEFGIGLVSMRERIELLNGKFDVRTAPGEGTCVSFEIPLED